jgi:RNA polymerase sporulation-specific sigma factor
MAHSGDKAARERLVMDNVGLVWSIVRRFTGRGCETEDLFQIGSIGLIKAIDKFDTSYDVRFSTYAVPMITGEIKRFLRDDGMIKVSRSIKELGFKVSAVRESLSGSLGREPTLEEISEALEVSKEEVAASLAARLNHSMRLPVRERIIPCPSSTRWRKKKKKMKCFWTAWFWESF